MQTFGWYSDQLTYSNDNLIVALYCEGPPCAEFSTASLGSLSQCPPKQLPCENTDSLLSKKSVAEKVGFVMKALPPPPGMCCPYGWLSKFIFTADLQMRAEGGRMARFHMKWFLM